MGIMPNMVHSLDASNIYAMLKDLSGNVPIFTIHDCFGGLAFDMAAIEISVKNAFISLYYTEP
jgi:DNA-directed RNA polymerase